MTGLTMLPGGLTQAPVLGLDLSLTSTGLCRIYPDGIVAPWTITSKGKTDWTMKQRLARVRDVAARVCATILSNDRVIVEGSVPTLGSQSGKEDLVLMRGLVMLDLTDRGITVDVMAPSAAKKWATGSGASSMKKDQMGLHIGRLYPNVELSNSDEVDALAMAHCAAVRAGFPVPTRAHHVPENWASVKWESAAPND